MPSIQSCEGAWGQAGEAAASPRGSPAQCFAPSPAALLKVGTIQLEAEGRAARLNAQTARSSVRSAVFLDPRRSTAPGSRRMSDRAVSSTVKPSDQSVAERACRPARGRRSGGARVRVVASGELRAGQEQVRVAGGLGSEGPWERTVVAEGVQSAWGTKPRIMDRRGCAAPLDKVDRRSAGSISHVVGSHECRQRGSTWITADPCRRVR